MPSRSSILSELPPPPPGKNGWPWTEESPQLLTTMPSGQPWPRVSIVTPSYNQGQFIEEYYSVRVCWVSKSRVSGDRWW